MESKMKRLKKLEAAHAAQYRDIGKQLADAKKNCSETETNQLIALSTAIATLRSAQALEQLVFVLAEEDDV